MPAGRCPHAGWLWQSLGKPRTETRELLRSGDKSLVHMRLLRSARRCGALAARPFLRVYCRISGRLAVETCCFSLTACGTSERGPAHPALRFYDEAIRSVPPGEAHTSGETRVTPRAGRRHPDPGLEVTTNLLRRHWIASANR